MRKWLFLVAIALLAEAPAFAQRVQLKLDTSEADAALVILEKESAHRVQTSADWEALFSTEPHRLLKEHEAAFHNTLTDNAFQVLLSSKDTIARTADLRETLRVWRQADLQVLGERVLAYLPEGAQIQASVFPEIPPETVFSGAPGTSERLFFF